MKKAVSLVEFSNTPSVSVMRTKDGRELGSAAGASPGMRSNKEAPAPTAPAPAAAAKPPVDGSVYEVE